MPKVSLRYLTFKETDLSNEPGRAATRPSDSSLHAFVHFQTYTFRIEPLDSGENTHDTRAVELDLDYGPLTSSSIWICLD